MGLQYSWLFIHAKTFPEDSGKVEIEFFNPYIKSVEKLDGKTKVLMLKGSIQQEDIACIHLTRELRIT